ncbi:flagellar hook-length control protein FliK [Devosia beringensis]|uniref:flagellar hook-length control protein FliK n=1 Tax=Devosia beringensis TaxID=2657486 RepID=UPI00186B64B1|nr:flagellar hook-length control protein FliK [Devosia beringensis]
MLIPGQLPQIVAAARGSVLQALALKAGQVISGTVIGPAPNGGTQVQIAGQTLNLVLPQLALAGEALRFEVQGSGAQLRLALQAAPAASTAPIATPLPAPASSAAAPPVPATPGQAAPVGTASSPAVVSQAAAGAAPAPAAIPATTAAAAATVPGPSGLPAASLPAAASAPLVSAPPTITPATILAPQTVAGPTTAAASQTPATVTAQPGTQGQVIAPSSARPAVPYAQASPGGASITGSLAALPGATAIPAAAPATGPVAQPAAAPAAGPAMASTPQAALAQMVQAALPQQNSIVGLTAALTSIAGTVALPEPVVRAAQQVLANQLNVAGGKLDGASLQKAVLNSGVFQEAGLARAGTPLLVPQADMKTSLLALRSTLTSWLGQQLPVIAAVTQVAPPLRGKFPRVTGSGIPPIDPAAAADEVGKHLLERTEAALSRLRLHQHASLPDPNVKGAEWSMDLPVVIAGHQTLLQLQIHRDEQNPGEAASERGWQMRFAINLPGMGEVGAQVSLRGRAAGVMLWASEPATSAALEADIDGLRGTLAGVGLTPGAIIVRHGAPPASPQAANSGHLVDATT